MNPSTKLTPDPHTPAAENVDGGQAVAIVLAQRVLHRTCHGETSIVRIMAVAVIPFSSAGERIACPITVSRITWQSGRRRHGTAAGAAAAARSLPGHSQFGRSRRTMENPRTSFTVTAVSLGCSERRLPSHLEPIGNIPPAEAEARGHAQAEDAAMAA